MECWKALLDSISLLRSRTGQRVRVITCVCESVCVSVRACLRVGTGGGGGVDRGGWGGRWGRGCGRGAGGEGVARDLRLSWPGNHIFLLCQTGKLSSKTISPGALSTDTSSQLTHFSTFSLLKPNINYTTCKSNFKKTLFFFFFPFSVTRYGL